MIYKNFYIKYKMSEQNTKEQLEKIEEDTEKQNSGLTGLDNVLEKDKDKDNDKEEEDKELEELEEQDLITGVDKIIESPKSEVP